MSPGALGLGDLSASLIPGTAAALLSSEYSLEVKLEKLMKKFRSLDPSIKKLQERREELPDGVRLIKLAACD